MSQKSSAPAAKVPAEKVVRDIRRATRKHHSAEDKIRIVLEGLRGEESIAALCRREAIAESLYYAWSKEFLEAGKRRLAGDTARAATTDEVKELRQEARALKEVVAEQALELRLLKKRHDRGWGRPFMRYPASEKLEIIRLVEQSHLPARRTLRQLGIQPATFYRWLDRYQRGGPEALADRPSRPERVWNRIPDTTRSKIIDLALSEPELSPRELAVRFTDQLAQWLVENAMGHLRGTPCHPQTQGKIERWHQTLKNRILLENYYLPGDLEAQIEAFVEHYNHRRYHESLRNLTPADVYFGRSQTILLERERIKRQTIQQRRLIHQQHAT